MPTPEELSDGIIDPDSMQTELRQLATWMRTQGSTKVLEDVNPYDDLRWKGSLPDILRLIDEKQPHLVTVEVDVVDADWWGFEGQARSILAYETKQDRDDVSLDTPRAREVLAWIRSWLEARGIRDGDPVNIAMAFYDENGNHHLFEHTANWCLDLGDEVSRRSGTDPETDLPVE
jgi:hypothetical protein